MKALLTFFTIFFLSFQGSATVVKVTNTQDLGNGSLRQALIDANANSSVTELVFEIPTSDPNYDALTGVYTITVSSAILPAINRKGLVFNGLSQQQFTSNSNPFLFGSGGTVGVDALTLPQLDGPEIEIIDGGGFRAGLIINSKNVSVKGVAISGFGNSWFKNDEANILVTPNGKQARVEKCVIGSRAHALMQPSNDANKGSNFQVMMADSGVFTGNFVAFGDAMGGFFRNGNQGWTVSYNEFYKNALVNPICDGLDLANTTKGFRVEANLFKSSGGVGFDTYLSAGEHYVVNNTAVNNGLLAKETPGMRIYGKQDTLIKNLLFDNVGAGIMVTSDAYGHFITQNSIYNNGNAYAQVGPNKITKQIGIDLLASRDDHEKGSSNFVTLNDDGDGDLGANRLFNFPVITNVSVANGQTTIKGFAPAQAQIEFFLGQLYPGAHMPQGKTYLNQATEGSAQDQDQGTGSYGPGPINGQVAGNETGAERFAFTFSTGTAVQAGDLITATAYDAQDGSSEFGPYATAVAGNTTLSVQPLLDCIYIDKHGDIVAQFGYNNPNATSVSESIGAQNTFSPGASNQGQPTSFAAGIHNNVFQLSFASSASRTWTLQNTSLTADISSPRCPVDLQVTHTVSNNTPSVGDQITFTVNVANLTSGIPATGVDISYLLDPNFSFVSASVSKGSYNQSNGIWSVNEIVNGAPVSLTIVVTVNNSGTNVASVAANNQPDHVLPNNSASSTVTINGGSSGGNNGGIESEGSTAELIAQRNYQRLKSGAHRFYDDYFQLPALRDVQAGQSGKTVQLIDFIPALGPQQSHAVVTSPTDLIGITNAKQVFSADYFKGNQQRLAAILALETNGEVYNHTKTICDRLNGGKLNKISTVMVDGHPFTLTQLNQENGSVDYAITFVAYQTLSGDYIIDNHWVLENYKELPNRRVFNFQVWSVSEELSISLAEQVLTKMKTSGKISYWNQGVPVTPTVYVKSGRYENGKMVLDIVNTIGADRLDIYGNQAQAEGSARKGLSASLSLDSSKTEETLTWDIGYTFDAGFALANNKGGGRDVLYFADGPWGIDYERNTGVTGAIFDVYREQGFQPVSGEKHLERDVYFEGNLKNYVSVYRMLRPGNSFADLSQYNQIRFEASLTGVKEIIVTLVSDSIRNWHKQFRTTISVPNGALNTYQVDFSQLKSLDGGPLRLKDIVNITFSVVGDQQSFQHVTFEVANINLIKGNQSVGLGSPAYEEAGLAIYPNPFGGSTQIDFDQQVSGNLRLEVVDLSGKIVDQQSLGYRHVGLQSHRYQASNHMETGVYLLKVIGPARTLTKRVIYRKY